MVISARSTLRISNKIFTANVVFPVPSRITILHETIGFLMLVLARPRSVWDLFFTSDAKFLGL
jgi:cytochrome b561